MTCLFKLAKKLWNMLATGEGGLIDQRALIVNLKGTNLSFVDYNHVCWECNYRYQAIPEARLRTNEVEVALCKICKDKKKENFFVRPKRKGSNVDSQPNSIKRTESFYF